MQGQPGQVEAVPSCLISPQLKTLLDLWLLQAKEIEARKASLGKWKLDLLHKLMDTLDLQRGSGDKVRVFPSRYIGRHVPGQMSVGCTS